jgi:hypothetical protein
MSGFEEALRNIEVFCRVLVKKIVRSLNEAETNVLVEPMEKLLRRKYLVEEAGFKRFVQPPQAEEPTMAIFGDGNCVKIFMPRYHIAKRLVSTEVRLTCRHLWRKNVVRDCQLSSCEMLL